MWICAQNSDVEIMKSGSQLTFWLPWANHLIWPLFPHLHKEENEDIDYYLISKFHSRFNFFLI